MSYFLIFIISVLLGFVGHFMYEFSNHKKIAALFFAVNESTWEHIKIGLTPLLLCAFVDYFFNGYMFNFWFNKFISIFSFIVLIPLLFYTYKYFLKRHVLIIDIFIFVLSLFLSVMVNFFMDYYFIYYDINFVGIVGMILILIAYFTWTYNPPKIFLFKDPLTNKYGIKGHNHEVE